jgi:hypothetical protein
MVFVLEESAANFCSLYVHGELFFHALFVFMRMHTALGLRHE